MKILTPQKMFQRLPIALTQVKVGGKSENVSNEILKNHIFKQAKEITRKVYKNITNSIKL